MESCLKIASSDPPPAPAGVQWISVGEAAKRAGRSERRIQQQCAALYVHQQLAEYRPLAQGGKCWMIREDADAAFARGRDPESIPFDEGPLEDQHRQTLHQRLELLKEWESYVAERIQTGITRLAATRRFVDMKRAGGVKKISVRTLEVWYRDYRRDGRAGLVDPRWLKPVDAADPFLDLVKSLYLKPQQMTLTVCQQTARCLAEMNGWKQHNYKACQRFIAKIPPDVVQLRRYGRDAYTDNSAPFLERDYTTLASNDIWCGDHHQFDVMVRVSERKFVGTGEVVTKHVRPWLTAWQDVRSRKIVGWMISAHAPNQDTILEAFRRGVLDCGVPRRVYIDNGKDYDSFALQGETKQQRRNRQLGGDGSTPTGGVFTALDIHVTHAQPYHGQSKPIERFFGTLESRFGKTWETYCGKDPDHKPENLQAKLDAGRAPTLEDLTAAFALWIENDYHLRSHSGDGMDGQSPEQIFAACLGTKRTTNRTQLNMLLLKPSRPVKVTQNGVQFQGISYGQYETKLREWQGKLVTLRSDPRDLTHVSVWSTEGRFICIVEMNRKVGWLDQDALREGMRKKKQISRSVSEYHDVRLHLHQDVVELAARAAASTASTGMPDSTLPPPSLKPIRTALDDGLEALEKAQENRLRIAVGAESASRMSLEDIEAAYERQLGRDR